MITLLTNKIAARKNYRSIILVTVWILA